jgi:Sap, sulfolipid-1-addressing protein
MAPPNMPALTSGRGLSNMRPIIALPRVTGHHPLRVTALAEALPLALAAAVYPPALLVLLLLTGGPRPRPLVGAYFAGAALLTVGAGLVGLAVADGARLTVQHSRDASAATYFALGLLLLPVAAWAWRRGRRPRVEHGGGGGRIAEWSRRAASSRRWAFVLGLLMYLPSPLYLLAIKAIADSGDSDASNVLAVLICAFCVLLFVEVPLVALYVRPTAVAGGLGRVHDWLVRNSWNLAAACALAGAVYALVKGVTQLG